MLKLLNEALMWMKVIHDNKMINPFKFVTQSRIALYFAYGIHKQFNKQVGLSLARYALVKYKITSLQWLIIKCWLSTFKYGKCLITN